MLYSPVFERLNDLGYARWAPLAEPAILSTVSSLEKSSQGSFIQVLIQHENRTASTLKFVFSKQDGTVLKTENFPLLVREVGRFTGDAVCLFERFWCQVGSSERGWRNRFITCIHHYSFPPIEDSEFNSSNLIQAISTAVNRLEASSHINLHQGIYLNTNDTSQEWAQTKCATILFSPLYALPYSVRTALQRKIVAVIREPVNGEGYARWEFCYTNFYTHPKVSSR